MTNKVNTKQYFLFLTILLTIISLTTLDDSAAATPLYVNGSSGNDAWNGETPETAKATIQNAVDAVTSSGTVYVADWVYNEHITFTQSVNLIGESTTGTIIDGTNNGRPLTNNGYTVTLTNFTIQNGNNTDASPVGGGIYNTGTMTLTNCDVKNNLANGGTISRGGGIYNEGILTLNNCNLESNTVTGNAAGGGGIYNSLGTLTLTNTNLKDNTVNGFNSLAGGIYSFLGTLTLSNCLVESNTVTGSNFALGGGIYVEASLNPTAITDCTVRDNTATGAIAWGGGIYNMMAALTLDRCNIESNTASGSGSAVGGGIYNQIAALTLIDSTVQKNTATGGTIALGGGVYKFGGEMLTLTNCLLQENSAVDGGGIYINSGPLTITDSHILSNTASGNGGGIFNYGTITSEGTTFNENSASGGGAVYNRATSTFNSCTFINNNAIAGGAMVNDHETLTSNYSRIVGNTATAIGQDVHCDGGTTDLENNWWGTNFEGTNPVTAGRVTNAVVNKWLVLGINATPTVLNNGESSTIVANIFYDQDGTYHDPTIDHIPDGLPVIFVTNLGSIGSKTIVKNLVMGGATATLTADETGGTAQVNGTVDAQTVSTEVTIKIQSSLYLTITPGKTNPLAGETVTYTLKVGNNGPDAAENVVMTYTLPEGMEFVGASDDIGNQWTYDPATRTITWTLGTVPVGDPTLLLNLRFLRAGNFLINPLLSTTTYDPTLNEETQSLIVNAQQAQLANPTTVEAKQVNTISMQSTGAPMAGIALAILMVMGGMVSARRK